MAMHSTDSLKLLVAKIRDRFNQTTSSVWLFPALTVLLLVILWGMTQNLISTERVRAEQTATALTQGMLVTYEAQALRALREIDQTLKLVKYTAELKGAQHALWELKAADLLPSELLFVVSIADAHGDIVASTRATGMTNIAGQEYFRTLRQSDIFAVNRPLPGAEQLQFGRRLNAADGSFAGVVTISVDAAYFVSGYDASQFGKRGVMGLMGTDGVFRVKRTGDSVSVGEVAEYTSAAPATGEDDSAIPVALFSWDGMRRYTSTRKLYGFPLTIIVGLSEQEQLAGYHRSVRGFVTTALLRGVVAMLFAALLTRMSWQLSKSRQRELDERKLTEQNLRISAAAFDAQQAMMITDANSVILKVNRAFTENTGYPAEELVGQHPSIFRSGRHNDAFYREMWETVRNSGIWQGEIWDLRKDGSVFPKWLTISAVKDDDGNVTNFVCSHDDITERKKSEIRIDQLAYSDTLTNLPNRTRLMERLQEVISDSRDGSYAALIFIDLDHFKTINDTLGHHVGDLLLQQVALRLKSCIRAEDTVARLGGDEFVVVLSGLSQNRIHAKAQTEVVGNTILDTLNQKYQLQDVELHNTPSIGATLFTGTQTLIVDLLKQADLAMYRSKDAGRNAIRFFAPLMESAAIERASLEKDLRLAVVEQQFLLHYQPLMAGEGHLMGVEVLIRWQHPVRGLLMPGEFIQLAENTKQILPMGNWVLETACAQLAIWASQPEMAHLTVAVNVSAHQFHQSDFVEQVLAVLDSSGANPERLKLELTESLLVSNVDKVIEKMNELKIRGVGFSLDDFGTGYSSLSYLKRLPLDQLKIDRSFVREVFSNPHDAAIAKTIIALANSLGMGVIAEGVETEAQREFLAQAGCDCYQGYLFSRPVPLGDFEAFAQKLHLQAEAALSGKAEPFV